MDLEVNKLRNDYLIDPQQELTTDIVGRILAQFQTKELPQYIKLWNYYIGKQAITHKQYADSTKPCNKVVTNFCYNIVQNYLGYLTGVPIQYENDNFDAVDDVLKYNDYINEDSELLKQALIFGRSFEINYIDGEGKQRFKVLDTKSCVPVYDNTLNNDLQYVIRFWMEDLGASINEQSYYIEVYGANSVKKYRSNAGFTTMTLIDEVPYYFGMCPVTVFSLNSDETSIYSQIMTLQDAYNEIVSGSVDDFEAFADAYLVLKGLTADEDELVNMKQNRVLMMDADCSAEYLVKNINDVQVTNLINNFKDNIHKIANSPDFNDEKFMAQSGVAIKYKLVGFENAASAIESNMKKALQRRLEIICSILRLTNEEMMWREANITFTRNLPTEMGDTVDVVNSLRGLVSDRTLLTQIPFVTNVDDEMKQVEEQKLANMELYSFGDEDGQE